MNDLFLFFVGQALLAAAMIALVLRWAHPIGVRWAAIALGGFVMLVSWSALTELLSRPKPIILERRPILQQDVEVLAARTIENDAIYLWVKLEGRSEPRSYTLPWDRRLAEQLQESLRQGERDGATVRLSREGDRTSEEGELRFYAEPPPPSPPKSVPAPAISGGTETRSG